ncbi:MAG TPA: hypothetical protein VF506_12610 [Streptosporangiaceae bacterium]
MVDVTKRRVNGAPPLDENGHLSEAQEAEIYRYYGISPGTQQYGSRLSKRSHPTDRPRRPNSWLASRGSRCWGAAGSTGAVGLVGVVLDQERIRRWR